MNPPARRILFSILAALILLYGAGRTFQVIATAVDQQTYPPPGKMISIDGHRLHLLCMGSVEDGAPTVVFESGLGAYSLAWSKVQPEVAKFTRACAYDRPGLGWSDASAAAPDSNEIANELYVLLDAAGVKPPYVLVAHAEGALHARVFAYHFPTEVKGLVLINAVTSDPEIRSPWQAESQDQRAARLRLCEAAAPLGLLRFGGTPLIPGLPESLQKTDQALASRSTACGTALAELLQLEKSAREAQAAGSLGTRPLVVIYSLPSAASSPDGEGIALADRTQQQLAALSTGGAVQLVGDTGDYIQLEQPAVVVEAIRNIVEKVRVK